MAKPMDKIRYGKWGGLIAPLGVLFRLFALITAQPGFLSISCGANTSHTAENNITWVTDAHYIDVGQTADISDASEEAYLYTLRYFPKLLNTLRYFPKPLNKSCYQLPVAPHVPHLLRLWFAGGFSNFTFSNFTFSIETLDMLANQNVTAYPSYEYYPSSYEYILVTSGKVLYICLLRTSETDDPFISAIELRRLQIGMYEQATPGTILGLLARYNHGGNSTVRYPEDKFDRIWIPDAYENFAPVRNVNSEKPISTNNTPNLPPTTVMQTAWVVNSSDAFALQYSARYYYIQPTLLLGAQETLLVLYFAEVEMRNMSEWRSFDVLIDGQTQDTVRLLPNYSAVQLSLQSPLYDDPQNNFVLNGDGDSTLPPIINAFEYYSSIDTGQETDSRDRKTCRHEISHKKIY